MACAAAVTLRASSPCLTRAQPSKPCDQACSKRSRGCGDAVRSANTCVQALRSLFSSCSQPLPKLLQRMGKRRGDHSSWGPAYDNLKPGIGINGKQLRVRHTRFWQWPPSFFDGAKRGLGRPIDRIKVFGDLASEWYCCIPIFIRVSIPALAVKPRCANLSTAKNRRATTDDAAHSTTF